MTVDQASEARVRAEAAGVANMVYHTWRWSPHVRFQKQLTDEGCLGRLVERHLQYAADYGLDRPYA